MTTEPTWQDIPGYEGLYQASSEGLVRSLDRTVVGVDGKVRRLRGRVLQQVRQSRAGHVSVNLSRRGQTRCFQVGQLILAAFTGWPATGFECCHNDGCPTNNHIGNLRWDTHSANMMDSVAHGRHARQQARLRAAS